MIYIYIPLNREHHHPVVSGPDYSHDPEIYNVTHAMGFIMAFGTHEIHLILIK